MSMIGPSITGSHSVDWVDSSESDDTSVGNLEDLETATVTPQGITMTPLLNTYGDNGNYNGHNSTSTFPSINATLTAEEYDAKTIREEFRNYQSILPKPDILLQHRHSFEVLRELIKSKNITMPRFLQTQKEGGIKPHYALCCLLLDEFQNGITTKTNVYSNRFDICFTSWSSWFVWILTFGFLYRQNHVPADIIREQFYRVAHVIPKVLVRPSVLRKIIRNRSLPIPNFFLDPESNKQFPPHIALLVILQDGEQESKHFGNPFIRLVWSTFAFWALVLRLVLEVIGGAGAIWGGSEVFGLRSDHNKEIWRWFSIGVGILCFLRFVTLNVPQVEDEGDILGPAGPWSLRSPVRLRAVTEHPFHYFVRATKPFSFTDVKKKKNQ